MTYGGLLIDHFTTNLLFNLLLKKNQICDHLANLQATRLILSCTEECAIDFVMIQRNCC